MYRRNGLRPNLALSVRFLKHFRNCGDNFLVLRSTKGEIFPDQFLIG
jgi:hypothetical protein